MLNDMGKSVFEYVLGVTTPQQATAGYARTVMFMQPKSPPATVDARCVQRQQFAVFAGGLGGGCWGVGVVAWLLWLLLLLHVVAFAGCRDSGNNRSSNSSSSARPHHSSVCGGYVWGTSIESAHSFP